MSTKQAAPLIARLRLAIDGMFLQAPWSEASNVYLACFTDQFVRALESRGQTCADGAFTIRRGYSGT
jgi:hypothetical protein